MEGTEDLIKYFSQKLLPLAIAEDIGSGDITTEAMIGKGVKGRAYIESKDEIVVCGLPFCIETFKQMGEIDMLTVHTKEGESAGFASLVLEIEADLSLLLSCERTALNILQRLSGIASRTKSFADRLEGTGVKLLDTRKTIPGYRLLEKYAVRTGGGTNHRIGLFDMYLIKDNHIEAAGDIAAAVKLARQDQQSRGINCKIEVECKTVEQVEEAAGSNADIIMLDNMDDLKIKKAIAIINRRAQIEVSGNITQGRLPNLARLNIDFISSGAITHSVPAKDFSMKIVRI